MKSKGSQIHPAKCGRFCTIKRDPKVIDTRKYNHFNSTVFLRDLEAAPFNEIKRFTNSSSEIWKILYLDILNKHAPVTKIISAKKANETGSKHLRQALLNIRGRSTKD